MALETYLDTSLLVPLFAADPHSAAAARFVGKGAKLILSDFAAAEFASVIAGLHRMGRVNEADARTAFANFDRWRSVACQQVETSSADMQFCGGLMRRLDLTLRTPDALHIAIAHRIEAPLGTFDARMATDARRVGVAVVEI